MLLYNIKSNYIEILLKSALATGNWGMKNNINKQWGGMNLDKATNIHGM